MKRDETHHVFMLGFILCLAFTAELKTSSFWRGCNSQNPSSLDGWRESNGCRTSPGGGSELEGLMWPMGSNTRATGYIVNLRT